MNLIERVARAINNALETYSGTDGEELMLQAAATAIKAMRDPKPEMIAAGEAVDGTVTALPIWQAMIDALPIDTYEMEPIDTSFGVGEG